MPSDVAGSIRLFNFNINFGYFLRVWFYAYLFECKLWRKEEKNVCFFLENVSFLIYRNENFHLFQLFVWTEKKYGNLILFSRIGTKHVINEIIHKCFRLRWCFADNFYIFSKNRSEKNSMKSFRFLLLNSSFSSFFFFFILLVQFLLFVWLWSLLISVSSLFSVQIIEKWTHKSKQIEIRTLTKNTNGRALILMWKIIGNTMMKKTKKRNKKHRWIRK